MDSGSSPCEFWFEIFSCMKLMLCWPLQAYSCDYRDAHHWPGWVCPPAHAGPGGTTMDPQQVSLLAGPTQDWETQSSHESGDPPRCWCASSPPGRIGVPIKEQIQTCLKYTSLAQMMGWPLWVLEAAWNNKTTDKGWNPDTETTKRLLLLQWDKVAACLPPSARHFVFKVYELYPVIFFLPFLPAFS